MDVIYLVFTRGLYGQGESAWKKLKKRDERPFPGDRHYLETDGFNVVVRAVGHDHTTKEWFAYCESLVEIETPERIQDCWLSKAGWERVKLEEKHLQGLTH